MRRTPVSPHPQIDMRSQAQHHDRTRSIADHSSNRTQMFLIIPPYLHPLYVSYSHTPQHSHYAIHTPHCDYGHSLTHGLHTNSIQLMHCSLITHSLMQPWTFSIYI